MDEKIWIREALEAAVRPMLSDKRWNHTLGCCEMGLALAERWGADRQMVMEATLVHDMTRNLSDEDQLQLCAKYGIINKYGKAEFRNLIHAETAAALAADHFGMRPAVVRAVASHTLGNEDMTLLDKIVYLSDAIEKGREYPGVADIRRMAFENLDRAMQMSIGSTLRHIEEQGGTPHAASLLALEGIERALYEQENNMNENNRTQAVDLTPEQLMQEIVKIADSRKAKDLRALHVTEQTTLADYLVIMTGTSTTHLRALADEVEFQMKEKFGIYPHHVEGVSSTWTLLDYTSVVVNVFMEESRETYDLERKWGDGLPVDLSDILIAE